MRAESVDQDQLDLLRFRALVGSSEALPEADRALVLAAELGDEYMRALVRLAFGSALAGLNRFADAAMSIEQGLDVVRNYGDELHEARGLGRSGPGPA